MSVFDWVQIVLYVVILIALAKPLGSFMSRVFNGERNFLSPILAPVERFTYRMLGTKTDEEMNWKKYTVAVL
ncbi:MAG TPA: potassium-transporting ATPase subunit KdpA, partial [Dehalococcoidales bacterium]|nr:potassium-transporting ATPase subunit KdpA [Dehalococcoidales bacterium]